jgi:hypothetical protein
MATFGFSTIDSMSRQLVAVGSEGGAVGCEWVLLSQR